MSEPMGDTRNSGELRCSSSERCENCRFLWDKGSGGTGGLCRRYPPKNVDYETNGVYSEFPWVLFGWWCGEWESRATGEARIT